MLSGVPYAISPQWLNLKQPNSWTCREGKWNQVYWLVYPKAHRQLATIKYHFAKYRILL